MRIIDLTPRIIKESFNHLDVANLGIESLVDSADEHLPDPAATAIQMFVGMLPGAAKAGAWGGIMSENRLEDAYSDNPSERGKEIREQLTSAFAPIKSVLKSKFDDNTITLYRAQESLNQSGKKKSPRNTLSWTSDLRVAKEVAGIVNFKRPKPVEDSEIQAAIKQYNETGEVVFRRRTKYVKSQEYPDYYDIYQISSDGSEDLITDGDDLLDDLKQQQKGVQEIIQKYDQKMKSILVAKIPIDDIIWITNRANQSEFILYNRKGGTGYVDATGKMISTT